MAPIVGAPTPADIPEPMTITGMRPSDILPLSSSTACSRSTAMFQCDFLCSTTPKRNRDVNFAKQLEGVCDADLHSFEFNPSGRFPRSEKRVNFSTDLMAHSD